MQSHSVTLDKARCIGCTDCIKRCPTEAIRVRGSKATIIEERCIDCGNCIRICRNGAKQAVTDELSLMNQFKYKVVLPAPSLYGQFPKAPNITAILNALYEIGFTEVFEVATASEMITKYIGDYLESAKYFPMISSSCPVIIRLIQRRFPSLMQQVLPIISPMELAARFIKTQYKLRKIDESQVGVFFISPCPAKATELHRPKGIEKSSVDGVFAIQSLYKPILNILSHPSYKGAKRQSGAAGIAWAMQTGGIDEKRIKNHIAVDGLDNVIAILEKVEDGSLNHVTYIEALACTGGCLGGVLNIENAFMSRNTLKKWIDEEEKDTREVLSKYQIQLLQSIPYLFEKDLTPRLVFTLDQDVNRALEKMTEIELLYNRLPHIDCGSCGAPTCRCFAEDVVMQKSNIEECIFILREKIKELSDQMYQLTQTVIPTDSKK
ncbi:[Fe-Fe] hydrogenase large subunit C-terminal domain-containing protein [Cellulosilyticum ruminicola]|uniref:[Fe-Fe] hydrogenase large subunit C-terminal domain-containing protein n=1 Tax=Cellulosilyticum ruminicola TaxID=425254 RepID=UPI0006D15342|nr:[Fe-Fe] hydrogenase large subunit C-terminal domain-containing protein [Cellulosilyticum ruminicola]